MATNIPSISLSNTFGQWLITTQTVLSELNNIGFGDYTKNSNTFTIDSSGTGLRVSNTATFGTITVNRDSTLTGNVSVGQRIVVSGNNSSVSDIYLDRNILTFSTSTPKVDTIISVNRGEHLLASDANAQIRWNETTKNWETRDISSPSVYYKILNSQDGGVIFTSSNSAFIQANTAYAQANLAFAQANNSLPAFDQANTARIHANLAFSQANTARTQANAAYAQANTAIINAADAGFLSVGTIPPARLGSGSATASTYLAGDSSWKTFASFPSGTAMLFVQTNAPTGWTKSFTHNDKALRVVSGSVGSGGTTTFSSVFTATRSVTGTVGGTTLTLNQIPAHSHTYNTVLSNISGGLNNYSYGQITTTNTGASGGSQSHTHGFVGDNMNFSVQYVDVIIATKD